MTVKLVPAYVAGATSDRVKPLQRASLVLRNGRKAAIACSLQSVAITAAISAANSAAAFRASIASETFYLFARQSPPKSPR
jgi:hypothetical protein